jgi:hypothetical protein
MLRVVEVPEQTVTEGNQGYQTALVGVAHTEEYPPLPPGSIPSDTKAARGMVWSLNPSERSLGYAGMLGTMEAAARIALICLKSNPDHAAKVLSDALESVREASK